MNQVNKNLINFTLIGFLLIMICFITGCSSDDMLLIKSNSTIVINQTVYINDSSSNLSNYYTKQDVYNKSETYNQSFLLSYFIHTESDPLALIDNQTQAGLINSKLDVTDQRYNDTLYCNGLNNAVYTYVQSNYYNQTYINDAIPSYCHFNSSISPLNDTSGNNNQLIAVNMTYNTTIKSYYSNGTTNTSKYLVIPIIFNYQNDFYIESRVYFSGGTQDLGDQQIWGSYPGSAPEISLLFNNLDKKFYFRTRNTTATLVAGSPVGNINFNQWYNVVTVKNSTTILLYVDGILSSINTVPGGNITPSESVYMFQSKFNTGTAQRHMNGSIEHIRFGNRSLSASEVLALNNSQPFNRSGLIAEYLFTNYSGCNDTLNVTSIYVSNLTTYNKNGYLLLNGNNISFYNSTESKIGLLGTTSNQFTTLAYSGEFQAVGFKSTSNIYTSNAGNNLWLGAGTLATSNASFTYDGNLTANGTSKMKNLNILVNITYVRTYWDDIAVGGSALASGAFAPTLTSWNGTGADYCYAGSVRNEYSYGSAELPHDWKEGTILYPHIHSSKSTSGVGNYTFRLDWSLSDSTHILYNSTNVTVINGAQWMTFIVPFNDTINASGFNIGSMWRFTLTRLQDDVKDNYADCAGVSQVSLHYEIDSPGSTTQLTK